MFASSVAIFLSIWNSKQNHTLFNLNCRNLMHLSLNSGGVVGWCGGWYRSEEEALHVLIASSDRFRSVNFWFLCVKPFSQTPFVSLKSENICVAFCAKTIGTGVFYIYKNKYFFSYEYIPTCLRTQCCQGYSKLFSPGLT